MTKSSGDPPAFAQAVFPELTNLGNGDSTCKREYTHQPVSQALNCLGQALGCWVKQKKYLLGCIAQSYCK